LAHESHFPLRKESIFILICTLGKLQATGRAAPFGEGLIQSKVIAAGSRGLPLNGESLLRHSRMFLAVVRLNSPQAGSELETPAIKKFGGDVFGRILMALF
jgi:hypothetical protein